MRKSREIGRDNSGESYLLEVKKLPANLHAVLLNELDKRFGARQQFEGGHPDTSAARAGLDNEVEHLVIDVERGYNSRQVGESVSKARQKVKRLKIASVKAVFGDVLRDEKERARSEGEKNTKEETKNVREQDRGARYRGMKESGIEIPNPRDMSTLRSAGAGPDSSLWALHAETLADIDSLPHTTLEVSLTDFQLNQHMIQSMHSEGPIGSSNFTATVEQQCLDWIGTLAFSFWHLLFT